MKIAEKVSFNIATQASYVYIFSGQKSIKNSKNFGEVFEKPEACDQAVLPDRSIYIGQELMEKANIKISNATFWVIVFHWKKIYW